MRKFTMAGGMAFAAIVFCAAPGPEVLQQRKILAQEKSPFALITVSEADGKRFISIGGQEQSAVDLGDKRQWVYKYTYLLSLAILARAPETPTQPVRCLMIGLGGGSFADFLAENFPDWKISVVEIDPVVIRLARQYFPINKRVEIVQGDGRVFLKKSQQKYDIIIMDAFGEHFIPPDLYTLEYFQLLKRRLGKHGLALMNAWENDLLDARELATLRRVFEKGYYIHHPQERPGNRIYLLAAEMDSETIVKKRIAENFVKYNFPGESPRVVLSDMKDLHAGPNRATPVTDANVRALFAKTPLN